MTIPNFPRVELETFEHPSVRRVGEEYWFFEQSELSFPGQSFGLAINEILFYAKLRFQDILVFSSRTFGNVLVLNGIVQCCERDEFAYQEMIAHVPLMAHAVPERVLVIGGGDCGVLREVVKHMHGGTVRHVTMVEIDDMVIRLLERFLPKMAPPGLFDTAGVDLKIMDGFQFLRESSDKFDVIITDSSDPEGPAVDFFEESYFEALQRHLNPGGIVIMQSSENVWLNMDYLLGLLEKGRRVFRTVQYCQCYMPSYTSGQLGLIVATDKECDLSVPQRVLSKEEENIWFRYYNSRVHQASFILPTWANLELNKV